MHVLTNSAPLINLSIVSIASEDITHFGESTMPKPMKEPRRVREKKKFLKQRLKRIQQIDDILLTHDPHRNLKKEKKNDGSTKDV